VAYYSGTGGSAEAAERQTPQTSVTSERRQAPDRLIDLALDVLELLGRLDNGGTPAPKLSEVPMLLVLIVEASQRQTGEGAGRDARRDGEAT
jgi:hypothetical protein